MNTHQTPVAEQDPHNKGIIIFDRLQILNHHPWIDTMKQRQSRYNAQYKNKKI
ncbi:MAG: hypothetical protein GY938_02455 [Ketobacter sp.]|nr:hypothetical protein [Ketobacter sp.]